MTPGPSPDARLIAGRRYPVAVEAHGATLLEGYPVDTSGGRVPSANVYQGTLSMLEGASLSVAATRLAPGAKKPRIIVRRKLP